MKPPIFILCLLFSVRLSAQELVQFHSEEMKQEFIWAGADLNGDGEIRLSEAEQVTVLFFGINPSTTIHERNITVYSNFYEGYASPSYRGCHSIPDSVEGTGDCDDCGDFPGNYVDEDEDEYTRNFQGLEKFTSLEHLGISTGNAVTNLTVSQYLKTFILYDRHLNDIVFPTGSVLNYINYSSANNSGLLDISNCFALKEMVLTSPNLNVRFSDLNKLKKLVMSSLHDLSDANFEKLSYAEVGSSNMSIDFNDLPSLERLFLDNFENSELLISSPSLKELNLYSCSGKYQVSDCPQLTLFKSSLSDLSLVSNNPLLEKMNMSSGSANLLIEDLDRLKELRLSGGEMDEIEIRNVPELIYCNISSYALKRIKFGIAPSLKYFNYDLQCCAGPRYIVDLKEQFNQSSALEVLNLEYVSTASLDLGGLAKLRKLFLKHNEIETIAIDGGSLEDIDLVSSLSTLIDFSEEFNPWRASFTNVNSPDFDASGFTKIERISFHDSQVSESISFGLANNLRRAYFERTNVRDIELCNNADNMYLSIDSSINTDGAVNVVGPIFNSDQVQQICAFDTEVEMYSCNGTYVGNANEVALGIDSNESENPRIGEIYPNPTSDFIYWNENLETLTDVVEVYSLSGTKVLSTQSSNSKLYLGDLNPGIYLVNFISANTTVSQRVVVQ